MITWDQRYRRLDEGEIIRSADEVQNDDGSWRGPGQTVGQEAPSPHYSSHRVYRRAKANKGGDHG